ncbi:heptosyltransferase I [uncultured bacterium]|nr:heptosyltransferase I [uncultured bacterium]
MILIVKLSSIGDVVHTLPALESLHRGFKKAKIDWLVEEAASSVLKGHPLINELIVVKRGWGKNFSENLKAAKALKARQYDLVLDFQGLLKSGIWVLLSKGRRRVGFSNARELSHLVYNEKLPAYDVEQHAVDRYLTLAEKVGGQKGDVVFRLGIGKAAESIKKKLKAKGVSGPFFVMVTRGRWATKLWRDDRFIALAKKLTEGKKLQAVLAGSPSDKEELDRMAASIGKGSVNMAGDTDLKELFALFSLAAFAVTVDSGPMHIAAASGTRTVALFGPTAPWRTGPYGKGHVIVRKGLPCSPCFKRVCASPKCMEEITVEDVMDGIEKILAERNS